MINYKKYAYSNIKSVLSSLLSFCQLYNLPIPNLVSFWNKTFIEEVRIGLFAATGAEGEKIFESLTKVKDVSKEIPHWICEASPFFPSTRLLLSDGSVLGNFDEYLNKEKNSNNILPGILILNGSTFEDAFVSITLCGTIQINNKSRLTVDEWLDRVSLPIIVSPASAVLGNVEVELMQSLSKVGRNYLVIITGIEGETEQEQTSFIKEIEEFKIRVLHNELGSFTVLYATTEITSFQDLKVKLASALRSINVESEKLHQLKIVTSSWINEIQALIKQGIANDQKKFERLDYIRVHSKQQLIQFNEIISQECLAAGNRLYDKFEELVKKCEQVANRFADWSKEPIGNYQDIFIDIWNIWQELIGKIKVAPQSIFQALNLRLQSDASEFFSAYSDALSKFNFLDMDIAFVLYEKTVDMELGNSLEKFQQRIERKSLEIVNQLSSNEKEVKQKKEHTEPKNKKELLRPIQSMISKTITSFESDQTKIEILNTMREFLDSLLRPAIVRTINMLLNEIANQMKTEYQKAFFIFKDHIESQIDQKVKELYWSQCQTEFSQLYAQWNNAIADFVKR